MSDEDDYRGNVAAAGTLWGGATADKDFPGLVVNPTPGIPGAVAALAASVQRAVDQAATVVHSIDQAVGATSGWQGPAAEGMRGQLAKARPKFAAMDAAFAATRGALQAWADQLTFLQGRAWQLELDARAARARLEHAEDATGSAALALFGDVTDQSFAAFDAADAEHKAAQTALQAILDQAAQPHHEHRVEAESVAAVVKSAADKGPKAPEDKGVVRSIGEVLDTVGDGVGIVSTLTGLVATVLAVVPGGQPFALPVGMTAAGLGALALVLHGTSDIMGVSQPGYVYVSDVVGGLPVLALTARTPLTLGLAVLSVPVQVTGTATDVSAVVGWTTGVDPIERAWNWVFDDDDGHGQKTEAVPVMTAQDRTFVEALGREQQRVNLTPKFQK